MYQMGVLNVAMRDMTGEDTGGDAHVHMHPSCHRKRCISTYLGKETGARLFFLSLMPQ